MTVATVEKDRDRRGARPLHKWHRWPNRERNERQFAKIDRRTTMGRLLAQFKRDLEARVTKRNYGTPPDAVDAALIIDACLIRADLAELERQLFGTGQPGVQQNAFVATLNAFRKTLGMLGCGEMAEMDRKRADTSRRAVETRLFKELTR
jgi:hypothetical protein